MKAFTKGELGRKYKVLEIILGATKTENTIRAQCMEPQWKRVQKSRAEPFRQKAV